MMHFSFLISPSESKCFSNEETTGECSQENSEPSYSDSLISFRVVWNKTNYDVTFDVNDTVGNLRKHIETLTGYCETNPVCPSI